MSYPLSLQARKQIEEFILDGVLRTEDKITERDMAVRLGMSRAPVREAIRELINAGLLEQISARQIVVRQLLFTEIEEIFDIRAMLEGKAAALAAGNRQSGQLKQLQSLFERMILVADSQDYPTYFDLNIQFHKLIHQIANAPRLLSLIDQIMRESLLLRSRSLVNEDHIQNSINEHNQILMSLESGDSELAELLMIRHVQNGFNRLELE
ncbi:GntR family transcriptional regulator [Litorivicinus sp.]|nr:GntR family transcriptional regulator [Litorivicinaceae bacterium]MDB2619321.1 GntR family transcriptional regulator [Litorivicinaceae bacterium]MDC0882655.1 GntR family transcriptional regulator [Litorivicinus sp.]MDC1087699.1 GntR family transcriptional regulator [Litorivicinus sp.]